MLVSRRNHSMITYLFPYEHDRRHHICCFWSKSKIHSSVNKEIFHDYFLGIFLPDAVQETKTKVFKKHCEYVLVYTYKKIVFLIFSVCMYIYTQEDGASISFSCYSILFRRRRGRKRCPPILLQKYLSLFALCIHT